MTTFITITTVTDESTGYTFAAGAVRNIGVIAHALCPHDSQIECHRVQAMDCGQR